MSMKVLLHKSNNNKQVAQIAENSNYYEVAVSRYYYSIYQKVTYILKENTEFESPQGTSPHVKTDEAFKKYALSKVDFHELPELMTLGKLKKLRIKADYHDQPIEYKEFHNYFKKVYESFSEKLESLLEEVDSK